jgi:hypothetical protein
VRAHGEANKDANFCGKRHCPGSSMARALDFYPGDGDAHRRSESYPKAVVWDLFPAYISFTILIHRRVRDPPGAYTSCSIFLLTWQRGTELSSCNVPVAEDLAGHTIVQSDLARTYLAGACLSPTSCGTSMIHSSTQLRRLVVEWNVGSSRTRTWSKPA